MCEGTKIIRFGLMIELKGLVCERRVKGNSH